MLFRKKRGVEGFELQTYFSQDVLFINLNIKSEVMVVCLHLKHISLGFNIYHWHF